LVVNDLLILPSTTGLWKAKSQGLYKEENFCVVSYEHYEQVRIMLSHASGCSVMVPVCQQLE
jgi:hypothetical protein